MNTVVIRGEIYNAVYSDECNGCYFGEEGKECPTSTNDGISCTAFGGESVIFVHTTQTKIADFIEQMASGNTDWTSEELFELADDIRGGMVHI